MMKLSLLVGCLLALMLPAASQADVGSDLNGLGSFGISLGAMRWIADGDASEQDGHPAQIRPIGKAVFRYRWSSKWTGVMEAGFGWNSYAESNDLVTWVIPLTVGFERNIGEHLGETTFLALGSGLYVWGQRRGGEFIRDEITQKNYHAADPGVFVGLTGEFHLASHVTVTNQLNATYIYSLHSDDFRSAMGDDDVFVDVRIGINYYFSTREGLIIQQEKAEDR